MKISHIKFSTCPPARRASHFVLDILLPRFCIGCDREGVDFCRECLHNLRPHPVIMRGDGGTLDLIVTLFPYGDPMVRNLIQTWKYDGVKNLVEPITTLIKRGITNLEPLLGADLVLPIPLHWFREKERGFNQAEVIAHVIEKCIGASVSGTIVRRVRRTESQSRLRHDSPHRAKNVRAAFGIPDPSCIVGKRCLLIDDVVTTGSTMAACARVLREAGAVSVHGFAFARG